MACIRKTVTTDASGDADVNFGPIYGYISAIRIDYDAGAAVGTDVVVSQASPLQPILTLTNANTDGIWYPRIKVCDVTGTAMLYDAAGAKPIPDKIYVSGDVTVVFDEAGGATTNYVTIWYERKGA